MTSPIDLNAHRPSTALAVTTPQAGIPDGYARVNVTWSRENGDLRDPVSVDASDTDVKRMVQEALRSGGVTGIRADANADLTDFVVDRFGPNDEYPFARIIMRPKTPFGFKAPDMYRCPICGSMHRLPPAR